MQFLPKESISSITKKKISEDFQELIATHFQGIELDSWQFANLESFGLKPEKLIIDAKNLTDHFEKHMGDVPVDTEEKYKKWIQVCYNKFFTNNLDLVIIPNRIYPSRLALYDLDSKQTLVIAFDQYDTELARFVTFHNQNTYNTYNFIKNSGLIQNPKVLDKIDNILQTICNNETNRQKKQIANSYQRKLRNARQNQIEVEKQERKTSKRRRM